MADAIVLITTQADKVSEAAKKIVEIPGVKDVYSVAGDVDLVAIVSADDFDDLSTIIPDGIAKVPGVDGLPHLLARRRPRSIRPRWRLSPPVCSSIALTALPHGGVVFLSPTVSSSALQAIRCLTG